MAIAKDKLLEELLTDVTDLHYQDGKLDAALKRAIMIVKKVFDEKSDYIKEINNLRFSPSMTWSGMDPAFYKSSFDTGRRKFINTVNVMIEDFKLTGELNDSATSDNSEKNMSNKIFIVHGHNEVLKLSAARFAEKLNFEAIILHEQANSGKTIIEKFTSNSDVSFAIVLLSADDLGMSKDGKWEDAKLRARQNVIFELGFFLGKLGRDKVVVLHEIADNFEIPSDYQGVIYIPFDLQGYWKFAVIKEMKAVGYNVDANFLL